MLARTNLPLIGWATPGRRTVSSTEVPALPISLSETWAVLQPMVETLSIMMM